MNIVLSHRAPAFLSHAFHGLAETVGGNLGRDRNARLYFVEVRNRKAGIDRSSAKKFIQLRLSIIIVTHDDPAISLRRSCKIHEIKFLFAESERHQNKWIGCRYRGMAIISRNH